MRALTGKELCRLLEHRGWSILRVAGSHHIYGKPGSRVRLSVPVHGSHALKIGLLKHLLKQAEISESEI
ncbi:MAG TPA: type II toxin-antitoxin system HicA family toxin [Thermoanaerobaculia bacterium]|nr:type II toxin-antitoxin system HicA family toxin [Thermoanaerobaculia bacterium]